MTCQEHSVIQRPWGKGQVQHVVVADDLGSSMFNTGVMLVGPRSLIPAPTLYHAIQLKKRVSETRLMTWHKPIRLKK